MPPRSLPSSGLISLFARHRNAANLVMVLMIIFGVFSMGRINTQFLPSTNIPVITISVAWPGASAEDAESNILELIEPEVRYLNGVDRVTSRAREGSATVALEYEAGIDMKEATREVETAVKGVGNLPEDSETPVVRQVSARFDRIARLAITGPFSENTLRFYAKKIRDDLIGRGIDKITFLGLRDRELKVDIPEQELRRLNMTIGDVSKKISTNSRDLPSGQMEGQVETQLRTLADVKSARSLRKLEIKSFDSGEKVRLQDVAKIYDGYSDTQPQGFSKGMRSIQLTIERAESADTLATNAILTQYMGDIKDNLPPNLSITVFDIRANALTQRILLLVKNGLGGLILVVGILYLFLSARIALWVAAGIPVAMLATIGFMWISGQTINMFTLFSLIMMLGIVVDDAIVVGEHTATRFAAGDEPFEAAENGAGRMIVPVSAAMITTIAAFAPIAVISGVLGQIIGVLPLVVISVIIASMIECFLILPGHLAHTLIPREPKRFSYWRQFIISLVIAVFVISVSEAGKGGWFIGLAGGLLQLFRDYLPLPVLPGSAAGLVETLQTWRSSLAIGQVNNRLQMQGQAAACNCIFQIYPAKGFWFCQYTRGGRLCRLARLAQHRGR